MRHPPTTFAARARSQINLTGRQSLWFDAMRGLAALAVLAYHIRYRFFADWSEIPHSATALAFYAVTSFGHDAVMVFFVLSGALISRSVIRARASGQWNWVDYATARATRLFVVLLPGLVLTLVWDFAGLTLFPDHPVYTGSPTGAWHDFFDVRARLTVETFFGNALFLQTIAVPPLGSNLPLWSLSWEFWYYALFPATLWALLPGSTMTRVICGVGSLAIGTVMGLTMLQYFPLWLAGALLWFLPRNRVMEHHSQASVTGALLLFASVLVACHGPLASLSLVWRDYLIGAVFLTVLYAVLHLRGNAAHGKAGQAARLLAAQSYTLYVVHVPLLVFCRASFHDTRQWEPSAATFALATVLAVVSLLYAHGVAQLTEARTDLVRERVRRWLFGAAPGPTVGIVEGREGTA